MAKAKTKTKSKAKLSSKPEDEKPTKASEAPETDDKAAEDDEDADPPFTLVISRNAELWLREMNLSIGLSTYQAGKMLFFGVKSENTIWVHNRNIGRCLGMALSADRQTLLCTADSEVYRFQNVMEEGQILEDGEDALYVPQMAYCTGDLDIHDIALDANGRLIFINTLFNCLATVSETHSFHPIWWPPFITAMVAEDRCHLNGLAMKDGKPKYVSMVSDTDTLDAWRENRTRSGLLMDIETNEVVASGLSMPHSPRWYRDRLWVLNSGSGEFGFINGNKEFEKVAFCPGYLRGLSFHGDYAIIGLSMPRDNTFAGLPLDDILKERKIEARCGIYIIDLRNGAVAYNFRIGGVITELYDVIAMPGYHTPGAISPLSKTDMQRYVSIGPNAPL